MAIRLLLVAATVVALAGCGGDEDAAAPPQAPASAPSSTPMLAASYDPDGSRIVWVDGRTLEPVDDRSVPVPFFTAVAALSADGAKLAVGESEGGAVQLVDVARMRALGTIEVTPGAWVERLHWATPDLLLASLGGSTSRVAALDPATLEVLSVRELGGVTLYSQPAGGAVVFLVAPASGIGPARLVAFDGSELRSVRLGEVEAGWEEEGTSKRTTGRASPFRRWPSIPTALVRSSFPRATGSRRSTCGRCGSPITTWRSPSPPRSPARLARAVRAREGDGRPRPERRLAPVGPRRRQRLPLHDGRRERRRHAGRARAHRPERLERPPPERPAELGHVQGRGPPRLGLDGGHGRADADRLRPRRRVALQPRSRKRGLLPGERAPSLRGEADGTRFEIVDLETGATVGTAEPPLETWIPVGGLPRPRGAARRPGRRRSRSRRGRGRRRFGAARRSSCRGCARPKRRPGGRARPRRRSRSPSRGRPRAS